MTSMTSLRNQTIPHQPNLPRFDAEKLRQLQVERSTRRLEAIVAGVGFLTVCLMATVMAFAIVG